MSFSAMSSEADQIDSQNSDSSNQLADLAAEFIEASPVLIWSVLPDGTLEYVNPAWREYTGLTLEEINRLGWGAIIPPEDEKRLAEARAEADRKGEPFDAEYRCRGRDGSYHWLWGRGKAVRRADGQITRWVWLARDITQRMSLKDALDSSERRYREIIQYAPTAIYEIDFRTDHLIAVNDSMVDLSGYSREELLSLHASDLLDEESRSLFRERARKWLSGEKPDESVEYRVKAKDGHIIYAILNASFTRDEAGRALGATVIGHDITERKLRELNNAFMADVADDFARLSTPEAIMQAVGEKIYRHYDLTRLVFADVDEAADRITVVYDRREPGLINMLGDHPLSEFVDESFLSEFHNEKIIVINDIAADPRTVPRAVAYTAVGMAAQLLVPFMSGGNWHFAIGLQKSQPYQWRQDEIELLEALAPRVYDCLERARAEERVRASEARLSKAQEQLRLAVEASQLGIYDYDILAGTHAWDHRSRELWGIGPDEVVTFETFLSGIHPEDRVMVLDANDRALNPVGDGKYAAEYRVINRIDGKVRWVAATGQVFFEGGRAVRLVGTVQDITERKWAEADSLENLRSTRLLQEISARLVSGENMRVLYEEILNTAISLLHADAGTIQILDEGTRNLRLLATRGFSAEMVQHFARVDAASTTSCGRALASGQRTFIDFDMPINADPDGSLRMHVESGYHSAQSTPLVTRSGQPVGMISTHWREPYHLSSERELRFLDLLARQAADLIERARAEAVLQATAARDAFRVQLTDSLRPLVDPLRIQSEACRLLGECLDVGRVHYADVAEDQDTFYIYAEFCRPDYPPVAGRLSYKNYGEYLVQPLLAGQTVVIKDINQLSGLSAEQLAVHAAMKVCSYVAVPLIRDGRLRTTFSVNLDRPRAWTADEVALIEEVAERTWATVERAQAEADLRRRNAMLAGINRIFEQAISAETDESVGLVCLQVAEELTESKFGFLGEINPQTGQLEDIAISSLAWMVDGVEGIPIGQGAPLETYTSRLAPGGFKIHGIYGRVLLDGKAFFTNDPQSHPDRIGTPAGHQPLTAFLGAPLFYGGRLFGMVGLANREGGYTPESQQTLEALTPAIIQAFQSKRAERALREANERFRSSIESLNESYVILSAVRDSGGEIVDFRYEYANKVTCEVVRRPLDQVLGHTNLQLVPEFKQNGLFDQYVQVVATGQSMRDRFTFSSSGGSERPAVQGVFEVRASKFGDGVIVTANDVTEQVRLETERQEAIKQREIHHRLAEQREMERQSYARDIHDGPIQTLSSLAFNLQYIKEVYPDPALKVELDQIGLSVKNSVQELRQVINELRPPAVIRFGLAKAIRVHAENLRERYPQITWKLELVEDGQLLPEQTCLALFRIYQEAISNIIRHAEATQAWVRYRILRQQVTLEIRDNGKGFAGSQDIATLTNNQHFGLAGISERAEAIHGQLEIKSRPGEGTTVRVTVPIKPKE